MACEITSGRQDFSCKTSIGGLKNLYILESFDAQLKANSTIANSVMSATTSANKVFKFELQDDSNTFSEENEVSRATGTSLFAPTGAFVIKRQDASTQELLENLSKMRAQVIIEDHNGNFRLAGIENGVDFTVASASGGAMADLNGYNLTFSGKEKSMAVYVQADLVSSTATEFAVDAATIDPNN
tara:strand:+ start:2519 stop:3073 length:555 start_codon:yes stop_codon:yes gene_type:complete